MTNGERWKRVIQKDGYEVSSLGRVRSYWKHGSGGLDWTMQPRILKEKLDTQGRPYTALGRGRWYRVSQLVAEAFLGSCPEGIIIAHGPGGKTDNRVENLSYKTQYENLVDDKKRDGTFLTGEAHGNAKFTEDQIDHVLFLRALEYTQEEIADEIGTSQSYISKILNGKARKDG